MRRGLGIYKAGAALLKQGLYALRPYKDKLSLELSLAERGFY